VTGALHADDGQQHVTSGEEAITAYLDWRKRHLSVSAEDGTTSVRLVPYQRQEPETPAAV